MYSSFMGDGIIPAYAGSTCRTPPAMSLGGDHPRVCGEHFFFTVMSAVAEGSSPRMRGARRPGGLPRRLAGIIPAYAGSTKWAPLRERLTGDHPRVCGEHPANRTSKESFEGSSPRMRGALFGTAVEKVIDGIIPAYAGSTPR